jgi:diguanylate cyclase (GGDEF)-like protein
LTGLYNRRAFETVATAMQNDASTAPLSLILVDLDHFKAINDRHGHTTGDSVLRRAADVIASHAGPLDLVGRGDGAVARWGREEFIILLRNMSAADAAAVAERMRVDLTQLSDGSWPDGFMVTASFGVAEWSNGISLHTCISRSDEAMYSAKQAGRNRVRLHGAETSPEEFVAI